MSRSVDDLSLARAGTGPPLPLRLVVTPVCHDAGQVLTQWLLFTNVDPSFDAATIGRWYAWRWRIETDHKLHKSAGQNAEAWQQETGRAFATRLVIAALAGLTNRPPPPN